jgi:hypothetical protein
MWNGIYHGIVRRAKAWGVFTTATKRTQITTETNRVLIVRRMRSSRTWCSECAREVDVVGLEAASVLIGMAQPALRDCLETGKWHFSESSEGALLICLDSLMKSMYADSKSRITKGERQ